MADKVLTFSINVQGVSKEAQAIAKIEIELSKLNDERRKSNKLVKEGKITRKQQADELARITSRTIKLRDEKRKLTKAERDNNRAMDKGTKSTNTFRKAIGSFLFKANFLANVMSNLVSKITQFATQAIKAGIKGVVSFDAAITDVSALTQDTGEQFDKLRDSAIALGGATKFTATQVALLQKEYAKLGFTSDNILILQESTLKLATATGGDLATAAKIVGGALRSYEKNVKDAADVSATLAIATTKSALAFEDFETILSTVGSVSNQYGFTLEDTLALLGQLRNANLDASKASTAFRNILLNLADTNGALAQRLGGNVTTLEGLLEAMEKLNNEGVDLAEALELTDKRSVNAFLALNKTTKGALALRDGITDVNKELDEMVNVQLSSLENKTTLLNSAWLQLIQTMADTSGKTDQAKGGVDGLTLAVQTLNQGLLASDERLGGFGRALNDIRSPLKVAVDLRVLVDQYRLLKTAIEDSTDPEETKKLIEQLNALIDANRIFARAVKDTTEETEDLTDATIDLDKAWAGLKTTANSIKDLFVDAFTGSEDGKKIIEDVRDFTALLKELENETIVGEGVDDENEEGALRVRAERIEKHFEEIDERRLRAEEAAFEERRDLAQRFQDSDDERREQDLKEAIRIFNLKIKLEDQFNREKQEIANNAINIISAFNDRALEENEARFKQGLITEKKFQEESLRLRQRQARFDKAQAIFNIGVNTAVAVSKITAEAALLAPFLIPAIIASGILAAAGVAARPIPQFADSGIVPKGNELPTSTAKGDNTLALVKPGEVILNDTHQAALGGADTFRRIGVPGFADSGRVPSISAPQPSGGVDTALMSNAIARAIREIPVVLNVNELNSANDEISVITDTNNL